MEDLLFDEMIRFINEFRGEKNKIKIKESVTNIAKYYYSLLDNGIDILDICDSVFKKDPELYCLVLSVLFVLFKEKIFLDKTDEIMETGMLPLSCALSLYKQVSYERFLNVKYQKEYIADRELFRYLTKRMQRELRVNLDWIPPKNRNLNRVIVATNTLLGNKHAPSWIVKDVARRMQKDFGFEVLVLVTVEKTNIELFQNTWINPISINYNMSYDGNFTCEFDGDTIAGYQYVIDMDHLENIQEIYHFIQEWNPNFIWYVGSPGFVSELFGRMTDMVATSCTEGYAVSDARVLASYLNKKGKVRIEENQYIVQQGQQNVEFNLAVKYQLGQKKYSKEDFGIPENSFVISIVGNRLDQEITHEFIEIMEKIVCGEKNTQFLIIGNLQMSLETEFLQGHVVKIGFQENLADAIAVSDLFLNPPRKGGGGGATCALISDIPIITLPNCDVAQTGGESFICNTLNDMPDLVFRYYTDAEFYKKQSKIAHERLKEGYGIDQNEEYAKVIECVQKITKE